MSDNSINIKGLNFKNLPDDFKIEVDSAKISYQTGKALEKIEGVDISDGIDKTEAELIIMEINSDDNADEISMDEIRKFCSDNKIADKNGEVKTDKIEELAKSIVSNAREILDPKEKVNDSDTDSDSDADIDADDDESKAGETPAAQNDTGNNESSSLDIKINIQPWKSTPEDGNKYANDCLDHIMRNYYPDITPYSQEWRDKELEIMNANSNIYGTVDSEGNISGTRKTIGGTERHSAVLYDNEELVLPGIKTAEPTASSGEDDNTPAVKGSAKECAEKITDDNGYSTETLTDENGNIVGKKQYDNEDNIMWESTIAAGENNTTVETKTWTNSGTIQEIVYDENGKEISINTTYADGSKSTAEFSYDENENKTANAVYFDTDNNQTASAKLTFDTSGSYVEDKEYTNGIKETLTYDQYQAIVEKTITKADNTKTTTAYENRKPNSTVTYDAEGNEISTSVYEYTENGYNETITFKNPEKNDNITTQTNTCNNDGKIIETNGAYLDGSTYHSEYTYEEDGSYSVKNTYNQKEAKETNYKEREIKYDSAGNKISEKFTLEGNETTGEISGTGTFENGKEIYTQLEEKTGISTTKTIEGDTVTLSVSQGTTNTTTVSKNGVKTKETVIEYAPESTNELSKTETEFYDDGITPKTVTVTKADGTTEITKYDENGNPINSENNNDNINESEETKMRADIATAKAQALHAAMDRAGTDEDVVKDIINNTAGQDLVDVIKEYERMYGTTLEKAIKDDFSWMSGESNLLRKLDAAVSEVTAYENMIKANPELKTPERTTINKEMVQAAQLQAFKAATSNRLGTDERVLFDMFQKMDDTALKDFLKYCKAQNVDVKEIIKGETSLETQKSLIQKIKTLEGTNPAAKTTVDPQDNTERSEEQIRADIATSRAQALHAAMDRAGTDEDVVKDIINNTAGQDLVDVIKEYERMYGTTLEKAIKDDFSWMSGESNLLRKLDAAVSEVTAYENMIKANPELKTPERTTINKEMVQAAQLQAFKAATSNRLGTDEMVVYQMLQNGSMTDDDIKALDSALKSKNSSLIALLKSEFSGETLKALIRRVESLGIKETAK